MPEEKFWMLFVEGGNSPTKRHYDRGEAEREAERLCNTNGHMVHLLESVSFCDLAKVTWHMVDDK